jgi:hypothetical protein
VLDPAATGLPALPLAGLALHQAEAEPPAAAARLADILLETVRGELARAQFRQPN